MRLSPRLVERGTRVESYVYDKTHPLENWLQPHLRPLALVVVALGFAARFFIASRTFLNPDESLHYLLANHRSLRTVYEAGLTSAHPPLFLFLLHFWRYFGNSEMILRLPGVLAGTAFLWFAFKWLGEGFDPEVGLIGLFLLAFSPTMILISAQIRQYAPLFLFMAGGLYFLERAFQENSWRRMALFMVFLYLAILTHYSALWFTFIVGIYALLRMARNRPAGKVVQVWVASQVGALALYAFFYVTHISRLTSAWDQQAVNKWLHTRFFQAGEQSAVFFAVDNTVGVFQYAFAHDEVGITALILFLLGVGFLLLKGGRGGADKPTSRELGLLLTLPFAVVCAAAFARIYPYGNTRETLFLDLFLVAGMSFTLGHLGGRMLWPGLLSALIMVTVSNLDTSPVDYMRPRDQAKVWMSQALQDIHQSIPPGATVFVEYETSLMLRYYLCRDQIFPIDDAPTRILEFHCGEYRVVSVPSRWVLWVVEPKDFPSEMHHLANAYGVHPPEPIWMIHMGWNLTPNNINIHSQLAILFPELNHLPYQNFGENISIFQFPLGMEQPFSIPADAN